MGKKVIYWLTPIMGILFVTAYIRNAVCDVVYTDYIRLINSYLPDVFDPSKFFVPDLLTRIPINYLARAINVTFFRYSTMFDMMLGVLGLGISAFMITKYCIKRKIGLEYYLAAMLLMFSLNKWEMLINGSGWVHFMAFACFYYHYYIWDRMYSGEGKPSDKIKLIILPWIITLGVAGPYCAIYSVTMILTCLFCAGIKLMKKDAYGKLSFFGVCTLSSVIPLFLYLLSNSYAVEEHAGAVDWPLIPTFLSQPLFFVRFFIKSFASMVIGSEAAQQYQIPSFVLLALGVFVIITYLIAIYMNIKYKIYEKSILPLMLVVAGGLNHLLILVSRWIFLKESYGMSSRYALQFQIGIIGIFLTFGYLKKENGLLMKKYETCARLLLILMCLGNLITTDREIKTAPYRQEYFITMKETGLNFENESDETLKKVFQYKSGEKTRQALEILKNNQLNIFR